MNMSEVKINCTKCHYSYGNDTKFDEHLLWCNPQVFDVCPKSKKVDGSKSHGWLFDGDDPYVVCSWCKQRRDAITNRIITK